MVSSDLADVINFHLLNLSLKIPFPIIDKVFGSLQAVKLDWNSSALLASHVAISVIALRFFFIVLRGSTSTVIGLVMYPYYDPEVFDGCRNVMSYCAKVSQNNDTAIVDSSFY